MKNYDVIVIGGSAAGIPAAITARRHYPSRSILLVRSQARVPIPCGIPYVFGTVGGPEKNLIPDTVLTNNGIDLLVDRVVSIDAEGKRIRTKKGEEISYEKLVLSTGSEPIKLLIPGIDKDGVFYARKDVDYLQSLLDRLNEVRDVVVLGGGFIGVEFADEFRKRGLNVTIVELLPHCLKLAFEDYLCIEAEEKLRERGVNVLTNAKVVEVLGDEKVTGVRLEDGREIPTKLLFVGVGVRPNVELAQKAGLEVDRYGIVVDTNMRTSNHDIFACGDCASKHSFFTGKPNALRLASIATGEARIAGANLFEIRRKNSGVVGVFSTVIGDLVLATAGLTEDAARESGFEVVTGEAEAPDRHPGSMPGMSKMRVKLVFNMATGEIIGGQARGGPTVGELINTISTCIQNRMTADDIAVFQIGTHPAVTASPISYQMVNAAELAIKKMKEGQVKEGQG